MSTLCPDEIPTLPQSLKTLSASIIGQVGGISGSDSKHRYQVLACIHREKDSAVISVGDTFSRMQSYLPFNKAFFLGSCFSFPICK